MSQVKFTVFSDLHHHPAWFKADGPERLEAILARAEKDNSDFIIQLGDLCHQCATSQELIERYNNFKIKSYHVLGNHEFDLNTYAQTLQAYKMSNGYYSFDLNGFRFIVLDENYFSDFPGLCFHYSERNYFDHPRGRDWLNREQIDWFRQTVFESPYPCITFSHSTLALADGMIKPHDELQDIIKQSQTMPGRVFMCLNGHYHRDNLNIVDNVAYFSVNSASSEWIGTPHYLYPAEWYKTYEEVGNQIIFEKALCATVTIDSEKHTVDIIGTESGFVNGITREMTNNAPCDPPCTPDIKDRHFTF